jgi:Mrp family chromosome partitioning ATPase
MNRNIRILQRQTAQASPFDTSTMPSLRENGGALPRRYRTSAEDEIAKLVQSVFILPDAASRPGAVAFCGVDAGTGCSWVCARAAAVLAEQVPGTVCVIDANLRSPSLHRHFGVEIEAGFAEAMKDPRPIRDFTPPTSTSNLRLMTASAGWKTPNGALKPARLRTRFSELRSEFDYLLIDTPPISSYWDAVFLGQLTDGIILVVGSNSTRRGPARIAKESFEAAKVPMLGAVLNKRTYPIPEALYQRL